MKQIAINVAALTALAATAATRDEMAAFGLPITNDSEIIAIMEEERAAARKESTRAAVQQIMALEELANLHLSDNFEAIRAANKTIVAAREMAKQIALARAYGAETRDYRPLMTLLNIPMEFTQRSDVPVAWLTLNSEKVLASFKEQGQAQAAVKRAAPVTKATRNK